MGIWARRAIVIGAGASILVLQAAGTGWAQERKDCSDFQTQQEAQKFFDDSGGATGTASNLDVDKDGTACEGLPSGPGGARTSPTPLASASPGASPLPTTTTPPRQALPKNGAATTALALSGLSFLEAGYALTLWAKRIGVRSRKLPVYLMRKLVRAAHEGQSEVALTDDVYLVRRSIGHESRPLVPAGRGDSGATSTMSEMDVLANVGAPSAHSSNDDLRWVPRSSEWPFFTPPSRARRP